MYSATPRAIRFSRSPIVSKHMSACSGAARYFPGKRVRLAYTSAREWAQQYAVLRSARRKQIGCAHGGRCINEGKQKTGDSSPSLLSKHGNSVNVELLLMDGRIAFHDDGPLGRSEER